MLKFTELRTTYKTDGVGFASDELKNVFVGQSIVSVSELDTDQPLEYHGKRYEILLSNGLFVEIELNPGCEYCGNGHSWLNIMELNEHNSIITNLEVQYLEEDKKKRIMNSNYYFTLFIFFIDSKMSIEGDDGYGNGYYGGGFTVIVKKYSEFEYI